MTKCSKNDLNLDSEERKRKYNIIKYIKNVFIAKKEIDNRTTKEIYLD